MFLTTCAYYNEHQTVEDVSSTSGLNNSEMIITNDTLSSELAQINEGQADNLTDNELHAWGLFFNKENAAPYISSDVTSILNKYQAIYLGNPNKKAVYLTFDEGYENGFTPSILDILKKNNVKSIFFVTGHYIKSNPVLIERILKEGHKVGNHTMNHYSLPLLDKEKFEDEIKSVEALLMEKFKVKMHYLRPPKGEYSERVLAYSKQMGYKVVLWSFAYKDYDVNEQRGAQYAYDKVMKHLHNGAVILLHAVSKDNAEALDTIIKGIRNRGYEILPFDF